MLAYDLAGDGPAVVLLHPFPFDRAAWAEQVPALTAAGWRVVAPDLPGFGASPLPDEPASVDGFADAVDALLGHLGVASAAVVGLSMGGYVALALARRHPARVGALVLADTRASADSPQARAARVVNMELARTRGTAAIVERMLPQLLGPGASEALKARVRAIGERQPPEAVARALLAMRDRPDATDQLPHLRVPALAVVGEHDAITPPAEVRLMAAALRRAPTTVIPGAGHLSQLENPAAFNDALVDFLARSVRAR